MPNIPAGQAPISLSLAYQITLGELRILEVTIN